MAFKDRLLVFPENSRYWRWYRFLCLVFVLCLVMSFTSFAIAGPARSALPIIPIVVGVMVFIESVRKKP